MLSVVGTQRKPRAGRVYPQKSAGDAFVLAQALGKWGRAVWLRGPHGSL